MEDADISECVSIEITSEDKDGLCWCCHHNVSHKYISKFNAVIIGPVDEYRYEGGEQTYWDTHEDLVGKLIRVYDSAGGDILDMYEEKIEHEFQWFYVSHECLRMLEEGEAFEIAKTYN